jgi:predicted nucleotidyltransferase
MHAAPALYTPEQRDEVANRVLALLREDERIERAELSGSGTTGYTDRWSDVDVFVTVANGVDQQEVADSWIARLYEAMPVVHHFAVAFGDHHVRGFLLENLLELDIGFQPADVEEGEWPGPDAEGEAGFAWHDVLHAGAAIARGRPWRAQYYVGLLRWRTLELATDRLGLDFGEFKGVDDLPDELLAQVAEALPRSLEREELVRAARAATIAFMGELREHRLELAERLEPRLLTFLDEACQPPRDGQIGYAAEDARAGD